MVSFFRCCAAAPLKVYRSVLTSGDAMVEERPLFDAQADPPVFSGSSIPISNLFEALASGQNVSDFLRDHPSLREEQVTIALKLAGEVVTRALRQPALWMK